jgi:hypothetical protein
MQSFGLGAVRTLGLAGIIRRRDDRRIVGAWYFSIGVSLLLVFIGLYTHWSIILLGALLPFVPLVIFLMNRRRDI